MWTIPLLLAGIILVGDKIVHVEAVTCQSHHYLDQPGEANKTIDCPIACYAFWLQDIDNPDLITVLHQGCWKPNQKSQNQAVCVRDECSVTTDTKFCCCYGDLCNQMVTPGVKVIFRTFQTSKVKEGSSNDTLSSQDNEQHQKGRRKQGKTKESTVHGQKEGDTNRKSAHSAEKSRATFCAFHEAPLNKQPDSIDGVKGIDISQSTPSVEISTHKHIQKSVRSGDIPISTRIIRCTEEDDSCYSFWTDTGENSTEVKVIQQGCFKSKPEDGVCSPNSCSSISPPRRLSNQLYGAGFGKFCCCYGNLCNINFTDGYDPSQALTTVDEARYHLQDGSYMMYKEKTIIISLVSVCSVALITMGVYLLYRICLSSRKPSPDSLNLVEAPPSSGFDVEDLKINCQISQTRNGEVWKGTLGELPVAVKIFNANHKQLYQNEKYIYSLPHIEHSNLLKFYGTDERLTPDAGWKYLIILSYVPRGNLYEYLRNNTLEWDIFCKMCLGTIRGLIHLHTDIRKADKFKPTVAHRDLNTRNILVRDDLSCVIGDLGFAVTTMGSKLIKNGQYENAEQASLQDVGTLRYMAPELLDGAANLRESEASLKQIDVYALGLVLWEIATRCTDLYHGVPLPAYQLPYQREAGVHPTFEEMQILVSRNKVRPKFPEVWRDYCQAVRALKETIEDCWDHDAEARLTAMCVEERVLDMMTLWAQDSKNKGATPTITTTSNLFDMPTDPPPVSYQNQLDGNITDAAPILQTSNDLVLNFVDENTASHVITSPPNGYISSDNIASQQRPLSGGGRGITASASTTETFVLSPSGEEPPQKMLNLTLDKNSMVVGPRQGRNPTVERNTHKRSDEEIAISGNKLVYGNDRRGSDSVQSAPTLGDEIFDSLNDNLDVALVQSDALNHSRSPRIPLVQNQVHNDHRVIRPKVANLPTTNPLLRDSDGSHGDRRNNKSKLGKLIKVKDIGNKLSQIAMLAKRASKSRHKNNCHQKETTGSGNVDLIHGQTVLIGQNVGQALQSSNQVGEHDNMGANQKIPIQTEVRMKNGSSIVRPTVFAQNRQNSLGSSGEESGSVDSVHGHDNRIFTAEVGVARLEKNPSKGHKSVVRTRKGSHSKSTPDLSPHKSMSMKEFPIDGEFDESSKLRRPNSLSLRGHNYKNNPPTKSNTCESLNVLVRNNKNEADKFSHLSATEVSDPVSKIKRRIKTPVKVKHGRFSLYDDRLMAHFVNENEDLMADQKLLAQHEGRNFQRSKSGSSSEFLLDGCEDEGVELFNVQNVVHVV